MSYVYDQVIIRIVKEQEHVIGPLAWSEAEKVGGLTIVDRDKGVLVINGDARNLIDALVAQYERLFGRASHEVCRDATADILATMQPGEIPSSLR